MSYEYQLQLYDQRTGAALYHAGNFQVVSAGTPTKVAITDFDDAALSNPAAIASGAIKFRTAESVASVDIYGVTDKGYAFQAKGVKPGALAGILIDTNNVNQTIVIPWNQAGTVSPITAATEYDTGFDLVTDQIVLPTGGGVKVTTVDATEDISAGILSSESGGDADGFFANISVASAAFVPATVTVTNGVIAAAVPTRGALLADHANGANADDRGIHQVKAYRCDGTAKSISLTTSTGSDTGAGYIILPTLLTNLPTP